MNDVSRHLPSSQIVVLQRLLSLHLESSGVWSVIKELISKTKSNSVKDNLKLLKENGFIQELLKSLREGEIKTSIQRVISETNQRYIFLRLIKGKSFPHDPHKGLSDRLFVSVEFLGRVFNSRSVKFDIETQFNQELYWVLSGDSTGIKIPTSKDLLKLCHQIHIVVIRVDRDNIKSLVGVASIEWREILSCGSIESSVSITGIGSEARLETGIIDIRIDLVPALELPLRTAVIHSQLKKEKSEESKQKAEFILYAKSWWEELLQKHILYKQSLVKLFAQSESGDPKPVCSFVKPIFPGRLLASSLEAAQFVSLIDYQLEKLDKNQAETWISLQTFLARGYGDKAVHAILLCSLFLGFGLDAYVCVGRDHEGGHVWVMTRKDEDDVLFWESLTGTRYSHLSSHSYEAIGCVFNHLNFFANLQTSENLSDISFDLDNHLHWKCMMEDRILGLATADTIYLRPNHRDAKQEEEKIECQLRLRISTYR
eukprot:Gb_11334 [translate_table: standard]